MSLTEQPLVFEDASEMTTRRLRAAMLAGDVDALLTTLAPGAVVRSPVSSRARIEGHAEISGLEYLGDVGQGSDRVLFARASVGRQVIEEAVWLRFDDRGLITEMTLFVRPLAGLTALVAALACRLAGRRGRRHAVVARIMTRPLAAATRAGDAVCLRLGGIRTK